MQRYKLVHGLWILWLISCTSVARSQESHHPSGIDSTAEMVLRQLSSRYQQMTTAVFHVVDSIDEVQADGRKLQFSTVRKIAVVRPDKFKVETQGDVIRRTVWFDGKLLTVLDQDRNVYAQLPFQGTIDQTIDMLQDQFGMSIPAADILSADLYTTMMADCKTLDYIGLGYAGEESCHHVAFTGEAIDWQLWISTGDAPSLRKMVITYKQLDGFPQYTLQLVRSDSIPQIDDSEFTCRIPAGFDKIEIQPIRPIMEAAK